MVIDPSQLSMRKIASADLAIYVYESTPPSSVAERQSHPSSQSLQDLLRIRDTSSDKLRDLPNLVLGLLPASTGRTASSEKESGSKEPDSASHILNVNEEEAELVRQAGLPTPHIMNTTDASQLSDLIRSSVLQAL